MSARIRDINGWFEVAANPLSKTGVFAYKGSSIARDTDGNIPDPERFFNVYRPAEELADPDTINSFRLVPFVDGHSMLGDKPGFTPAPIKGVHGVTGDHIWFNPEDGILYGNLKIFSGSMEDAINFGKNEISLGYRCEYVHSPGISPDGKAYDYVQRKMRGNHAAGVPKGRMGSDVAVMDEAPITFDEKDLVMPKSLKERNAKAFDAAVKLVAGTYAAGALKRAKSKFPNAKITLPAYGMDADETEAVASEPGLSDIADMLGDVLPQIAEINGAIADATAPAADPLDDGMEDEMEPEMGADAKPVMGEDGKPKMKPVMGADGKPKRVKKAMPAGMDIKAVDKMAMDAAEKVAAPLRQQIADLQRGGIKAVLSEVGKRNALAEKLSHHVGAFDHAEMTLDEVAKYGVGKLEIPNVAAGQELTALQSYLHGRPNSRPVAVTGMDRNEPRQKNSVTKYLDAAD